MQLRIIPGGLENIPGGFLAYKLKVFSDNPAVLLKIQASL